jgi:hypothetical protein
MVSNRAAFNPLTRSPSVILPALVRTLTLLALPVQSRAQDDTNAALITDGGVWAQYMNQVMGGTSAMLPQPGTTIRGRTGIYAIAQLSALLPQANSLATNACHGCTPTEIAARRDEYITHYFGNLLANPAVSGL